MNFDEADPESVLFANLSKEWGGGEKQEERDIFKKLLKQ